MNVIGLVESERVPQSPRVTISGSLTRKAQRPTTSQPRQHLLRVIDGKHVPRFHFTVVTRTIVVSGKLSHHERNSVGVHKRQLPTPDRSHNLFDGLLVSADGCSSKVHCLRIAPVRSLRIAPVRGQAR